CNDNDIPELAQPRCWRGTPRFQRISDFDCLRLSKNGSDSSPRMGNARHRGVRIRIRNIPWCLAPIGEQYFNGELPWRLRPLQELPSGWTVLRHRQLSS